ncbi:hypothetical protein BY458DRAFT_488555 [Sporodiniella umbellata]|nr:hypothetical protein BY458DRAFT_488555 [Sporodiniella umbellata]
MIKYYLYSDQTDRLSFCSNISERENITTWTTVQLVKLNSDSLSCDSRQDTSSLIGHLLLMIKSPEHRFINNKKSFKYRFSNYGDAGTHLHFKKYDVFINLRQTAFLLLKVRMKQQRRIQKTLFVIKLVQMRLTQLFLYFPVNSVMFVIVRKLAFKESEWFVEILRITHQKPSTTDSKAVKKKHKNKRRITKAACKIRELSKSIVILDHLKNSKI